MTHRIFLFSLTILLLSCGEFVSESKAILKNKKGQEYHDKSEYSLAIKSFKEAIDSPFLSIETESLIYRNIAQTYFEMMEFDSSIVYSELAANSYPANSYEYLVNHADVKLLKGEVATAVTMLEKAIQLNPNLLEANNSLGILYLGDYGSEYIDAHKAFPYNLKAYQISGDKTTEDVLGRNYLELKDYSKARMHYSNLNEKHPNSAGVLYQLGAIEFFDGNADKADVYFNKLTAIDSEYEEAVLYFKENNQ